MKTIDSPDFNLEESDNIYKYQESLTGRLDAISGNFNQDLINEIVLWKVNRYAELDNDTLAKLNSIGHEFDEDLTRDVLILLLKTKGIQLPMASTILRFKNPNLYQIIDQRVYRILYGSKLKVPYNSLEAISLYLSYLVDLKNVCTTLGIDFHNSDRILYNADKRVNKGLNIRY